MINLLAMTPGLSCCQGEPCPAMSVLLAPPVFISELLTASCSQGSLSLAEPGESVISRLTPNCNVSRQSLGVLQGSLSPWDLFC